MIRINKIWKKRLKIGSIWAISSATIASLFELDGQTFDKIFLTYKFLIKLAVFLISGIFIFAYGITLDQPKKSNQND